MLYDRILGNVGGGLPPEWLSLPRDEVDLTWQQCLGRANRATSRGGRAVRVLLPPGSRLRHGDVLDVSGNGLLAVNLVPCEVLVVRPRDAREAARVALEIGNLHAPAQLTPVEILLIPDGPVEATVWQLGVPSDVQMRRFEPENLAVAPTFRTAPSRD